MEHFFKERFALFSAAGGDNPAHGATLERFKLDVAEIVGQIDDFKRVAKVRLVGAVFEHGFFKRNPAERGFRNRLAAAEFCEGVIQHVLRHGKDVFLCGERHFKVQLIKVAGRTVGARVFVAEAGRNLEIFVEARHHQKLFKLLGRLGQRVKLAFVFARGDNVVARTFGRRAGQNRGRDFGKAERLHFLTQKADDFASEQNVVVHFLVAQI